MNIELERILNLMRPVVGVIDSSGTIKAAYGGFGGFFGLDIAAMPGQNVLDHVAPSDTDEVALYLLESAGESFDTVSLPLPFRVQLIGGDGGLHSVDVIASAQDDGSGEWEWTIVLVPLAMYSSVSRSLDAEMSGATRQEVKELLTEELATDNETFTTRWFLIDVVDDEHQQVVTSRREDRELARVIDQELGPAWTPWEMMVDGQIDPVDVEMLPAEVCALARSRGWRRCSIAPVFLEGNVVAVYLLFGRVADDYEASKISSNVATRIAGLVKATALLFARWRDQDRLLAAATKDGLTGLANRDAFSDALARVDGAARVLYIDVDRFKAVNDTYGHDVGDRVLIEVARRLVIAGGPSAQVARFGGDEFVVLLTDGNQESAIETAERMLTEVARPLNFLGGPPNVTLSIGIAEYEPGCDVIDAADRAMLRAKRSGRGRFTAA